MNCKVISINNQKGGVAKSTTAVNLAIGLAKQGEKVCVVDFDPQGSATQLLGFVPDELEFTIVDRMRDYLGDIDSGLENGILRHAEGIDLIPANIDLSNFEVELINAMNRENLLRGVLGNIRPLYNYILIDTLPSLGVLSINALTACDSVIIPVQTHQLPAKGLEQLLSSIYKVKRQLNPSIEIEGILYTLVTKTKMAQKVMDSVNFAYGNHYHIFESTIPYSIKAVEAGSEGKSIYAFQKDNAVSKAYENLVMEVQNGREKARFDTIKDAER